jgi:hypothetical protein
MEHPERHLAKRIDMPGRCREFTDLVYSGRRENGKTDLWQKLQASERKFWPPASEYHAYIGELHGHCAMSDGLRSLTPELYFERLRSLPGLDFAALTDHDHGGVAAAELWDEGKWERIQNAVRRYYEPGRFTTLLAYERDSYPWYNNMVVYYRDDHGEMLRGERDGEITGRELDAALARDELLLVPHDTQSLSAGCDFNSIPLERMTPLIEIASGDNDCAEYFNHPLFSDSCCEGGTWQDALKRGARMGVIAGSDSHDGSGGLRFTSSGKNTALTGVWAKENTREAIFDALKKRRTFAFTGGRMKLDFRINGHYMGEEFSLPATEDRSIYYEFSGDAQPERIFVVKNCRDWVILTKPQALFFDYHPEQAVDCYYLRVITKDGRWCWSSPIWIHNAP